MATDGEFSGSTPPFSRVNDHARRIISTDIAGLRQHLTGYRRVLGGFSIAEVPTRKDALIWAARIVETWR